MPAKIGDRKIAKACLEASKNYSVPLPRGVVDSDSDGVCRFVYFDKKNGVVYKVDQDPDGQFDNKRELQNARYLWKKYPEGKIGTHLKLPIVSGYTFGNDLVIAMTYVKGRTGDRCGVNKWRKSRPGRRALEQLKFLDMHGGNYIVEDKVNVVWPVDLGSPFDRECPSTSMRTDERDYY